MFDCLVADDTAHTRKPEQAQQQAGSGSKGHALRRAGWQQSRADWDGAGYSAWGKAGQSKAGQ